jgi:nucleotide-binding universal stress UspA family protein
VTSPAAEAAQGRTPATDPVTIVVGVDGSRTSLRALDFAIGQAARQGARVVAVYVKQPPVMPLVDPLAATFVDATVGIAAARDDIEAELRAELDSLATPSHVDARLVIRPGDPLKNIVAVARQRHADLIIVGTSSRLGHRLAGSVAVRLVRQHGWPVTVVP